MRTKLTIRFILMVVLSTVILVVSTFLVLTYIEETYQNSDRTSPGAFSYNLSEDIEIADNGEVVLSEEGQEVLNGEEAWLQILDNEGYVTQSYNTPDYAAEHYSPMEITMMGFSSSYQPGYYFEVGRTTDDIIFLVAVPEGSWERYTFEIDRNEIIQFGQMMSILAAVIFLIMGFIFSRRIAKPVTQIIAGVEELSDGYYKAGYKEKGLYKSVFVSLNQLAERLKTSESEREKTREQRENWVSNISHDLKTPLSSIKGYSEILGDGDYDLLPSEIKEYSDTIYEKSLYMEEMIEELRLNEGLMHNGISLNKKMGNLTSFIREIIIDTLNHPGYSERTIKFQPEEEEITYSFDRELLKRCIENLIYNALIHNDKKTEVNVSLEKNKENIIVKIKDNGRGMNQEELDQLFNRYYRGSNTKNYKGTGLGMSIAKEVIEAHDGEIQVESMEGKGTEIKILL